MHETDSSPQADDVPETNAALAPLPGAAPSGRSEIWRWAPLLLLAVAWLAHASAHSHGWVLDDVHLVRDNPAVARGPSAIPQILAEGATVQRDGVEHGLHGTVAIASFALEAPLWLRRDGSLRPSGFHLSNLLLHGLCVLLLFRLMLAYAPGRPVLALGAALIFAVHPLNTGAVSALMGRAVLLAAFFGLAAALAWRRFGGERHVWLPVSALLWLLAILAHPAALGLPLVLWLCDRAVLVQAARTWAQRALLVFLVPLGVFLALGGATAGTRATAGDLPLQGLGPRLLIGAEGLVRLVLGLVIPTGLRGDHTDEALPTAGYEVSTATWVAVLLLAVSVAWVLVRVRQGRAGTGALLWLATVALVLPAAAVLPTGATLEARWGYVVALPLFGFAGLLAEGLLRAPGTSRSFAGLRTAMVGGLALVCLMGLASREAAAWRDGDAFHSHLLDRNPRHVGAMVRYADSQRLAAIRLRDESMLLPVDDPERDRLLHGSRVALARSDHWSVRAVRHELGRHRADAWRTRGFVLLAHNRNANALEALELSRDLNPGLRQSAEAMRTTFDERQRTQAAEMYFAIGQAREALGDREPAADAFSIAATLAPERLDVLFRAGMALCRVSRYADGLSLLLEVSRRTTDPERRKEIEEAIRTSREAARRIARRLLAEGHAAEGVPDMRKAVTLYEQAIEVNPASVEAWSVAGWLRGHWFGNYEQAAIYLAKAEALLRKGRIPEEDPRWERIRGFRRLLAKQRAEEDAELTAGDGG